MRAGVQKPYSSTVTMTGMKSLPDSTSHIVMTGPKMYVQVNGAWSVLPMGTKELLADMDDKIKTAKYTCVRKGSATVGGAATTIYAVHVVNQNNVSDNTLWISAAGLPLKTESHLGGGQAVSSVIDYDHVQAPPGVK